MTNFGWFKLFVVNDEATSVPFKEPKGVSVGKLRNSSSWIVNCLVSPSVSVLSVVQVQVFTDETNHFLPLSRLFFIWIRTHKAEKLIDLRRTDLTHNHHFEALKLTHAFSHVTWQLRHDWSTLCEINYWLPLHMIVYLHGNLFRAFKTFPPNIFFLFRRKIWQRLFTKADINSSNTRRGSS